MPNAHRSQDAVALKIGAKFIYLNHAEARKLFKGLGRIIRDIENNPPDKAECKPVEFKTHATAKAAVDANPSKQGKRF